MRFQDIPGHEDVKNRLRQMADSGRVPHALLLEGPEGSGKFALARAFAQYLHCRNRHDGDSCGVCPSCLQHQNFNSIDTHFSFPVVKRSGGKPAISDDYIAAFREFMTESPFMDFEVWLQALDNINAKPVIYVDEGLELIRKLNFKARSEQFKIVLMWLPERLQEEAANKMLKLIEEPHEDTIFLFSSNAPGRILPTIYSRTQRIQVTRYTDSEIYDYLLSQGKDENAATAGARLAEGSVVAALRHLRRGDDNKRLEAFATLMRKGFARDVPGLRKWSLDMAAMGREAQMQFVDYCARIIRENLMLNTAAGPSVTALTQAEAGFSSRFHPFVNERNVIGLFNAFNDARRDIAANGNSKIIFFDLAIQVITLIKK